MPIYACIRGYADNLRIVESDLFSIEDNRGRNWICCESHDSNKSNDEQQLAAAFEAHAKLCGLGFDSDKMHLSVVECADKRELTQHLDGV